MLLLLSWPRSLFLFSPATLPICSHALSRYFVFGRSLYLYIHIYFFSRAFALFVLARSHFFFIHSRAIYPTWPCYTFFVYTVPMRIPFPHAWLLFSFYFALLRAILYWFDHFFYMRSRAYSLFVSLTTFSFSFYDLASYFFYALVRHFFLCALALIYITPAPVSFIPRAHFFYFPLRAHSFPCASSFLLSGHYLF